MSLRPLFVLGALLGAPVALAAQQAPRMYVTNQDDATISVIDPATNRVETTIDLQKLGYPATAKPHHTQVEPDGSHWYATLIGAGKVLKFDRDNRVVDSASLEVPGLMALHPSKDLLVVARSMSAVNPPRRLALIRRSDMKVLDEIDVFFPRPHAIATNGDYAYVASLGVNQMASVALDSGTVQLVDVDGPQHTLTQFAISPDHRWLVATGSTSGRLLVFSLADPATPAFVREVAVEAGPFESAYTADGRHLVVSNLDANAVTFLDTSTWTVEAVVKDSAFKQPHGVAFGPDGRQVYVSNRYQAGGIHDHEGHQATGGGNVVAICVPTHTVDAVMPVGHYAAGISGVPPTPDARGTVEPASCR
ncbi:MAG: YncE family protein [Gemmatimonadales bacterium]